MLFKAIKTNHTYKAGASYELDENCSRVRQYVSAGLLEPIQKTEAIKSRAKKIFKPSETK